MRFDSQNRIIISNLKTIYRKINTPILLIISYLIKNRQSYYVYLHITSFDF